MRLHLRTLVDALAPDHEVCVVALRWPDQRGVVDGIELVTIEAPVTSVRTRLSSRALAVLHRRPVDWERLSRPFADVLPSLLSQRHFDVAHVALDDLAGISPLLGAVPSVIAPLDARHHNIAAQAAQANRVFERWWRRHQQRSTRRALGTALRPFVASVFVTEEDAAAVRALDPSLRTVVIPLSTDAAHFARPSAHPPRDRTTILFTGVLSAPANIEAVERLVRILPLVRESIPKARLVVAGRAPAPSVHALGNVAGVEVVADPDDLRPWLWRARVFACPMSHGTGMKTKLLEAMAAGLTSVATPRACRGLDARHDQHLLVADSDDDIAAALVRVMRDEALCDRLSEAARRYVVDHHSPRAMAARFASLYAEVAGLPGS